MKLFRKLNSRFYWYDFTVRGRRYRGSTQETKSARAAKAASLKLGSVIEGTDPFPSKPSVLSEFAERFDTWVEDGRFGLNKATIFTISFLVLISYILTFPLSADFGELRFELPRGPQW